MPNYSHSSTAISLWIKLSPMLYFDFLDSSIGKESACNAGDPGSISWVGKIPWGRDRLSITVFFYFPCGSTGIESAFNMGDLGSIPGLGRSLEKGKATHSSILAWRIPWTVHGVAKSWTRLSNFHSLTHSPEKS